MITKLKNKIKSNLKLYCFLVDIISIPSCIWKFFFSWRGGFRNYIWFHFCAIGRKLKIPVFYHNYSDLYQYKNKHKGETCFIIATGPSLTLEDAKKLKNYYTIGLNGFYRMIPELGWKPNYLVMLDPAVPIMESKRGALHFEHMAKDTVFLNSRLIGKMKGRNVKFISTCWLDHLVYYGSKQFIYSEDLVWGLYDAYSVTQMSINLAQIMGFKKIILLGVDNNYMGRKQHFDDVASEKSNVTPYGIKCQKVNNEGYKFIDKQMKKRGVKVLNATRGGSLEVFTRISLEEALEHMVD